VSYIHYFSCAYEYAYQLTCTKPKVSGFQVSPELWVCNIKVASCHASGAWNFGGGFQIFGKFVDPLILHVDSQVMCLKSITVELS
jgi:hypothetical protein